MIFLIVYNVIIYKIKFKKILFATAARPTLRDYLTDPRLVPARQRVPALTPVDQVSLNPDEPIREPAPALPYGQPGVEHLSH